MFIPAIPQESKVAFYCNNEAHSMSYCPGPAEDLIKECALLNMEQDNDRLICELSCETNESMWTMICDTWDVPLLCKDHRKDAMELITETDLNDLQVIDECLDMRVLHGQFPETQELSTLPCPLANETMNMQCDLTCNNAELNDIIRHGKIPDSEVTGYFQFWLFFVCLAVSWIGMAIVVTVGDAICFEMLGDKPYLYGKQRMWGSVGWGIVALVAGVLVDAFSKAKAYKDYSVVFYLVLVLILLDILVSKNLDYTSTKSSPSIMKDVGKMFQSFRVVIFLIWLIFVGLCTALIWNFLFWHLEDLAAADEGCDYTTWIKTIQGLVSAIQSLGGELPFFFLSGWIHKKIGHINTMSLILAGFALRFFLYSILSNPWWILPIELLNGVTFGLFHATMASYATVIAPPGTEATIQVSSDMKGRFVLLNTLLSSRA